MTIALLALVGILLGAYGIKILGRWWWQNVRWQ